MPLTDPKPVKMNLVDVVKQAYPASEQLEAVLKRRLGAVESKITSISAMGRGMSEEDKGKMRAIVVYFNDTNTQMPEVRGRTTLMEAALNITQDTLRGGQTRSLSESVTQAFAPEVATEKNNQRKQALDEKIRQEAVNGKLSLERWEMLTQAATYTTAIDVEKDPEAAGKLAFMESALKVVPTVYRNGGATRGATR